MKARELRDLLLGETNVLLYGPPGTGKTHLAQEVANLLKRESAISATYLDTGKEQQFLQAQTESLCRVFWVTFHQSYSYDNFVIGLRPDLQSENLLGLKPEPGVLLQAAAHASGQGRISLIVIDEVNRGNVGQVFGDFITIMEPDKRLMEDGNPGRSTVYVTLPYVAQGESIQVGLGKSSVRIPVPFAMPRRVYTLATMNSIDRSAAPLDAAIRRRFRIVNLGVDRHAIAAALGLEVESVNPAAANLESIEGIRILAAHLLHEVNTRIEWFLGRDFQMGQWYLGPLASVKDLDEAVATLASIWSGRIWPQLEESFALRPQQLVDVLKIDTLEPNDVLRLSSPPDSAMDAGALAVPSFDSLASPAAIARTLLRVSMRLSEQG